MTGERRSVNVQVRALPPHHVAYMRYVGPYGAQGIPALWARFDKWMEAHVEALRIPFDPFDMPREQFLVPGDAWHRCRRGDADPKHFGIHDLRGSWFVLQNLIRDLAALAKREPLPWDGWGLVLQQHRYGGPTVPALLDRTAELTQAGDEATATRWPSTGRIRACVFPG